MADFDRQQPAVADRGAARFRRHLDQAEIERVLSEERVVRVAFATGPDLYLIAFGYVWFEGALCGMTTRGRKTRLAEAAPQVAFQVDTSATTGSFVWQSVTGQGVFEFSGERDHIAQMGQLIDEKVTDFPPWLREGVMEDVADGNAVAFRIRPTTLAGLRFDPPPS